MQSPYVMEVIFRSKKQAVIFYCGFGCRFVGMDSQRSEGNYCWWFRNPIPNHLGCIKPQKNNGLNSNLNWWVYRISGCHQQYQLVCEKVDSQSWLVLHPMTPTKTSCTIVGEILQNDHTFAMFDAPKASPSCFEKIPAVDTMGGPYQLKVEPTNGRRHNG